MKILRTIKEFNSWKNKNFSLGLVPTMGALHQGHTSLIDESMKTTDKTVVSIFVNPTQFNETKDYENYPRDFEKDKEILENKKVDAVFIPSETEMYPRERTYKIQEINFSQKLCGKYRPGHFDGVLTVIMKLFQIIKPTHAFFGEKDFQQYQLIKNLCESFFLEIEIRSVPIKREKSGLAMSSRNMRLSRSSKEKSSNIYKFLSSQLPLDKVRGELTKIGFDVEYLEEIEGRRYIAAWIDGVRLIDNV